MNTKLLNRGDAEFLLQEVRHGKFAFRVGQVWTIPQRKGVTFLLCDYDGVKKISKRTIRARLTKCGVVPESISIRVSPGGRGLHVVVRVVGKFNRWQIVALQAILESDPEREAQNFRRAGQAGPRWGENWQALFR